MEELLTPFSCGLWGGPRPSCTPALMHVFRCRAGTQQERFSHEQLGCTALISGLWMNKSSTHPMFTLTLGPLRAGEGLTWPRKGRKKSGPARTNASHKHQCSYPGANGIYCQDSERNACNRKYSRCSINRSHCFICEFHELWFPPGCDIFDISILYGRHMAEISLLQL